MAIGGEVAVERTDGGRREAVAEEVGAAHDVGLTGEEGEDVALVFTVGAAHGGRHVAGDVVGCGVVLGLRGLDGVHAALATDGLGADGLADGCGVDGGRHHDEVEVGAENVLDLSRQTEGEVGLQAALMELVEDDAGHAVEGGVVGHASGEDALGDDLDAGAGRYLALEAYLVADGLTDGFAEELGHAHGDLSGGDASWLEHDDAALGHCAEHGEGKERRLTRTGWCHHDGGVALGQHGVEARGDGCGGEGWKRYLQWFGVLRVQSYFFVTFSTPLAQPPVRSTVRT